MSDVRPFQAQAAPVAPKMPTPLEVFREIVGKLERGELNIRAFVMVYYQPPRDGIGGDQTSITTVGLDLKEQVVSAELLRQFTMDMIMGRAAVTPHQR